MDELRQQTFGEQPLPWQTLWINAEQRQQIENILGHSFRALRIRYLADGHTTLWKFEEIGKEQLISLGVVVSDGRIANIQVMEYRESRGGEIRHDFFTKQFKGLSLSGDINLSGDNSRDNHQLTLSDSIDGITGATLSVRAMTKVATLALYCHQLTPHSRSEEPS